MTATKESARTGVFGGTFNPIHLGHLRAAEEVVERLGLERMIFVPSGAPPHKPRDEELASAALRLDWVERAVAPNPRFEVDALEIEREGASFTVDTLRALGRSIAPERPVFVIGEDAFAEIESWRDPEVLLTLSHFAVIPRPPPRKGSLAAWIPASLAGAIELAPDGHSGFHRQAGTWIRQVPVTALEVSSSDVRSRIRTGRSVRYLLPESVREAVLKSEAYHGFQPSAADGSAEDR